MFLELSWLELLLGVMTEEKISSVEEAGRPALLLLDVDSGTTHWEMINEILVNEHLIDWDMRDIFRFATQENEVEIDIDNKKELDPVAFVMDIFKQVGACRKGHKDEVENFYYK